MKKKEEKEKQTLRNFKIEDDLYNKFKVHAEKKKRSVVAQLKVAMQNDLDGEPKRKEK